MVDRSGGAALRKRNMSPLARVRRAIWSARIGGGTPSRWRRDERHGPRGTAYPGRSLRRAGWRSLLEHLARSRGRIADRRAGGFRTDPAAFGDALGEQKGWAGVGRQVGLLVPAGTRDRDDLAPRLGFAGRTSGRAVAPAAPLRGRFTRIGRWHPRAIDLAL